MVRLRTEVIMYPVDAYSTQVPEPPASGWPELHKTVRTADINKVDDCRDDIDTLLVFVRVSCPYARSSSSLTVC